MHRSEAIFKFFYGGFLQPLQVVLGRKRINGEPAKGKYQDHEQFLLTVYFAVVRYLLRRYMESVAPEDLMFRDSESSVDYLSRIQQQISEYRESWETSKNEPSKMLAMFIKITGSRYRSKLVVSNLDFWMCEYENCEWIGPWKMSNKTTYLRQKCEEIEIKYGGECEDDTVVPSMSPLELEIMLLNRICVLTEGGNRVAFDFVNELYNLWLKTPPKTPFFILTKAKLMTSHNEEKMEEDTFWIHVKPPAISGSTMDKAKEFVDLTIAERKIKERWDQPDLALDDGIDEAENYNDDNDSVASSVVGLDVGPRPDVIVDEENMESEDDIVSGPAWEQMSSKDKAEDAKSTLKKLGNVRMKKMHKFISTDVFVEGKKILVKKKIVKVRQKAIRRYKRKYQLIHMAMKYFETQMQYRRTILKTRIQKSKDNSMTFVERSWEVDYKEMMRLRKESGEDLVPK